MVATTKATQRAAVPQPLLLMLLLGLMTVVVMTMFLAPGDVVVDAAPVPLEAEGGSRITSKNCERVGPIKELLDALGLEARAKAMEALDTFHITLADTPSVRFGRDGKLFLVDDFGHLPTRSEEDRRKAHERGRRFITDYAPATFNEQGLPIYHSRPGAPNTIFLDFDGHTLPDDSAWGGFKARPYDPSSDGPSFSSFEQGQIGLIWKRISEDYAAFDVDVTTEAYELQTPDIVHCLVTLSVQVDGTDMPYPDSGGIAYVGVFGYLDAPFYSPALVYYDNLGNGDNDYVAEASSHEVGHNLGLSHDGEGGNEYADGRDGNSFTSWGPIMGVSYDRAMTQWSNGEYPGATNGEDDIAIIASHLGFVPDVAGSTPQTAKEVTFTTATAFKGESIILHRYDRDWWAIVLTQDSSFEVTATPWYASQYTAGNNLDIKLSLFDASSTRIKRSNPRLTTSATLTTPLLPAGTYFLEVDGTADGYTLGSDYGSTGQYSFQGFVTAGGPSTTTTTTAPSYDCTNDAFEPNEEYTQAAALPYGSQSFSATICPYEQDWFLVPVCGGGNLTITVLFTHAEADLDVLLFSPTGDYIDGSLSGSDNELLAYADQGDGGTYYLHVYSYYASDSTNYTLQVQLDGCPASTSSPARTTTLTTTTTTTAFPLFTCPDNDQYENNNRKRRAAAIIDDTMYYAVTCGREKDWFRFMTCRGAEISATIELDPAAVGNVNFALRNRRGRIINLSRLRKGETQGLVFTTSGRNGAFYITVAGKQTRNVVYRFSFTVDTTNC